MMLYDFIFSAKRPEKYYRHIAFWIGQCLFWMVWAGSFFYLSINDWINDMVKPCLVPMLLEIAYTYLTVYYILPVYFIRRKKARFIVLFSVCNILAYLLYVLPPVWMLNRSDEKLLMGWYFTMNFIINGPPVICAMFLTIKMLKNYYLKMEEKRALTKENAQAELQLLKAQVHPHFLFNTLNNIYSFTLTKSSDAGSLVLKLSDTFRYMINECDAAAVPLEKEIQLLTNYLALEKVRYGNRLNLQVQIKGDYQNKMIAPLLMIPFVENSFKHGVSIMRGAQWIKIELTVSDKWLYFSIANSKPLQPMLEINKEGIGLVNVQKRLQLLYPGKHSLKIESTDKDYWVYLHIDLEEQLTRFETINTIIQPQSLNYA